MPLFPDVAKLTVRAATPADRALVVGLLAELVDEIGPREGSEALKGRLDPDIAVALASPAVRILVAELDGEAMGISRGDVLTQDPIFRLREDHRCGYVDQMYVRQAFRGRGVGQKLLHGLEEWFKAQGVAHVLLHAAPRAIRFYAREGFLPNREMFKRLL